jgi:hypothetical protein
MSLADEVWGMSLDVDCYCKLLALDRLIDAIPIRKLDDAVRSKSLIMYMMELRK